MRALALVGALALHSYRTRRGSLYKARALQYAVERSTAAARAWVMHLEEESHITQSVAQG
jgi:hypothetical protein